MLADTLDAFILRSTPDSSITFPRMTAYLANINALYRRWLSANTNTLTNPDGHYQLSNVVMLSVDVDTLLNTSQSELFLLLFNKRDQIASMVDTTKRTKHNLNTFIKGFTTEEHVVTYMRPAHDYPVEWADWAQYRALRLVAMDAIGVSADGFTGKLVFRSGTPSYAVFMLDPIGLCLQYAAFLKSATQHPDAMMTLVEFLNVYAFLPCFTYDVCNQWLLRCYGSPDDITFAEVSKLSVAGGSSAAVGELRMFRDRLERQVISSVAYLRQIRLLTPTGSMSGYDWYAELFGDTATVNSAVQTVSLTILSRSPWIEMLCRPHMTQGPKFQSVAADLKLGVVNAKAQNANTRAYGPASAVAVSDLMSRLSDVAALRLNK